MDQPVSREPVELVFHDFGLKGIDIKLEPEQRNRHGVLTRLHLDFA